MSIKTKILTLAFFAICASQGCFAQYEEELGQKIIGTLDNVKGAFERAVDNGKGFRIAGYPYLSTTFGVSRMYGEFARVKVCFGSYAGYMMYGGVGKDWVFKGKNKEQLAWHAGCGYYVSPDGDGEHEVTMGVCYSQNPICEGGSINFDLGYTYFIPALKNRLGIFAGAGFGIGNLKYAFDNDNHFDGKFLWDVGIGISIKIFANTHSDYYD
ncbi:MAG: hypothetical protein IKR63_06135 [Alloprevotella sp.]|nr:hypothetical protein [Alloprevotella sp.]